MPKISVIMGVYNTSDMAMLRCSIDSILNQSVTDFEFIICDDGSTDDTYNQLKKIAPEDSRIVLLQNHKNMGLAATLNRCMESAQGEYIARQDADDYSSPDRLKKQVDFLEKSKNIAFVGSWIGFFDDHGEWGEYCLPEFPVQRDFLFTVPVMHGSVVFRREALLAVGKYRVAKETRRAEDYDLFMRMYAQGYQAANLPDKLYFVREDAKAQQRRKYCYRIDDVIVRYKGFTLLGLMPKAWPFVLKPLLVGLIPCCLLQWLKDFYYGRKRS